MTHPPRTRFVRAAACLLAGALALGAVLPVPAAPMTETVLPNGMRVVLRPVRTNPVVCSAVLVRSGVAWEPEGMSGASHFLEHLLFNGTTSRTQEQLYADVERIGAYNNATTRADHTLFLMLAPSDALDRALEIQADMLLHSTLPEQKFAKEKGIVLEEMRRDANNPAHLVDLAFTRLLHAGSPYARPVLGTVDSIRGLAREDVLRYYHDRYRPENMVLFLAGDFDEREALAEIAKRFPGSGSAAAAQGPSGIPEATLALAAPARLVRRHVEAGRAYLRAAFAAPAPGDPAAPAFDLLVRIATEGESAPLERALVASDPPAAFNAGFSYETIGGTGFLELDAALTGKVPPQEVVLRARQALADAAALAATDAEALRAIRERRLTEEATLEEQVHYYAMFNAPELLYATAGEIARKAKRTAAVGPREIREAAERFLADPRGLILVAAPDVAQESETTVELPPVAVPQPQDTQPVQMVLDNGLTLSIRPDPGSEVFAVELVARNRSALEPAARPGLTALLHELFLSGTETLDARELDRALQVAGVRLKLHDDPRIPFDDYQTSPDFSFVRLETRSERAPEALRLLAEMLQHPRLSQPDIDRAAARLRDRAVRALESPSYRSRRALFEMLAPGHPLSRPVRGEPGSFGGLRREELLRYYERLFAPQNLILAVRGGSSAEAVRTQVERLFGGRGPAGGAIEEAPPTAAAAPTAFRPAPPVTTKAARKEEQVGKRQSSLRFGSIVAVAPGDLPALEVAVLVLSGRLQMDLRETQGLAYSIGASLSPVGGGRRLLQIAMGTAPENVDHAEREILRIVRELRAKAPGPDEIGLRVAAHRGRIYMRRLTGINRAYYDALRLLYGEPTGGDPELLDRLRTVTPEQVQSAAQRYIDPERFAVAIAR